MFNAVNFGDAADAQLDINQDMMDESVSSSSSLVHDVEPVEVLAQEYKHNPMFLGCIEWLSKMSTYKSLQRLKGDGNCFYRAFSYAFVNAIICTDDRSRREAICHHVESTLELLKRTDVDEEIARDFFDPFQKLVKEATKLGPAYLQSRSKLLMRDFNDPETSNSIVVYMRLIASAYLKVIIMHIKR